MLGSQRKRVSVKPPYPAIRFAIILYSAVLIRASSYLFVDLFGAWHLRLTSETMSFFTGIAPGDGLSQLTLYGIICIGATLRLAGEKVGSVLVPVGLAGLIIKLVLAKIFWTTNQPFHAQWFWHHYIGLSLLILFLIVEVALAFALPRSMLKIFGRSSQL